MALSTALKNHPDYHTVRDAAAEISQPAIKASLELMWAFLVPVAMGTESQYDKAGAALDTKSVNAAQMRLHSGADDSLQPSRVGTRRSRRGASR